jgi:predicted PurR-regulated permease PerM
MLICFFSILLKFESQVIGFAKWLLKIVFVTDVAGIPGAGLWALLCPFLAIIHIGVGPVIFPVIIYAFLKMSTLMAVILIVWLVLAALSVGPLKAVLLGRGASVPLVMIFLGAIGGYISFGFLGPFIGAVILSVGYKLLEVWLQEDTQSVPVVKGSGPTD